MGRKTKEEEEKLRKMAEAIEQRKKEEQAAPELAFGMRHIPGKPWEFVIYTLKNNKVTNVEVKECMDKDHAVEMYKINFVTRFIEGK